MLKIIFEAKPFKIGSTTIILLPEDASAKLSSRGQVAVSGVVNGYAFKAVMEPDGRGGHWLKVDKAMQDNSKVAVGKTVELTIEQTKDWPEPDIPKDFAKALSSAPQKVKTKWKDITPMARWEWIRWVNSTGNLNTRGIRIDKSISKMNGTHRRPCCFNLAACTDPSVSKNSMLLEPPRT